MASEPTVQTRPIVKWHLLTLHRVTDWFNGIYPHPIHQLYCSHWDIDFGFLWWPMRCAWYYVSASHQFPFKEAWGSGRAAMNWRNQSEPCGSCALTVLLEGMLWVHFQRLKELSDSRICRSFAHTHDLISCYFAGRICGCCCLFFCVSLFLLHELYTN